MLRGSFHRWPGRSAVALMLVLILWPVSHHWQPRVMVWLGTTRLVGAVTEGSLNVMVLPPNADRTRVNGYVTAWAVVPEPPAPATSSGGLFVDEFWLSVAGVEHSKVDSVLDDPRAPAGGGLFTGVPPIAPVIPLDFWGFMLARGISDSSLFSSHEYIFYLWRFPIWIVGVALGLWVAWRAYWAYSRRRLFLPEHCRGCGYDLRASLGRCPECGLPARQAGGLVVKRGVRRFIGVPRRMNVWIRRRAGLVFVVLCLMAAGAHFIPRDRVALIHNPKKFVRSQMPTSDWDGSKPFVIIYDLSDFHPILPGVDDGTDPAVKFIGDLSNLIPEHGMWDMQGNWLVANLDGPGQLALVARLNAARRARK